MSIQLQKECWSGARLLNCRSTRKTLGRGPPHNFEPHSKMYVMRSYMSGFFSFFFLWDYSLLTHTVSKLGGLQPYATIIHCSPGSTSPQLSENESYECLCVLKKHQRTAGGLDLPILSEGRQVCANTNIQWHTQRNCTLYIFVFIHVLYVLSRFPIYYGLIASVHVCNTVYTTVIFVIICFSSHFAHLSNPGFCVCDTVLWHITAQWIKPIPRPTHSRLRTLSEVEVSDESSDASVSLIHHKSCGV